MRQPGRPRKEVDFEQLEKLCEWHCNQKEIAEFFRMNPNVLKKRVEEHYGQTWAELIAEFKGRGKCLLRKMQWKSAEQGNVTMQIFLGKNYLGQSDKLEQKVESTPINIQFIKSED